MSDSKHHKRSSCIAAVLIAAATLPQFLLGLGDRNIWIPLEARYALVAREMLETGQWILPHLGGMVYADKPPLLFWSIALLSALGPGVTEWTARLPSALAAVGVCLMTWRLGVRCFSPSHRTPGCSRLSHQRRILLERPTSVTRHAPDVVDDWRLLGPVGMVHRPSVVGRRSRPACAWASQRSPKDRWAWSYRPSAGSSISSKRMAGAPEAKRRGCAPLPRCVLGRYTWPGLCQRLL